MYLYNVILYIAKMTSNFLVIISALSFIHTREEYLIKEIIKSKMEISLIIFYILPYSLHNNIIGSKKFFVPTIRVKLITGISIGFLLLIFHFPVYIPYSRHMNDTWTQKSIIGKGICKEYNYLDNAAIIDELRQIGQNQYRE